MSMKKEIPISTTHTIANREIAETIGIVKGSSVQTRHIGSHILSGLQTIIGGEVKGYSKALIAAREEATSRMIADAESVGADAIVGFHFSTSQIMEGAAEMLAYGTAVKLK